VELVKQYRSFVWLFFEYINKGAQPKMSKTSLQLDFDKLQIDGVATSQSATTTKTVKTLAPGDTVSVKYRGKEWRTASIVDVRPEGSFDVAYNNDEHENGVPPSMIRVRDSPRHIKATSPVCLMRH